MKITGIICEYNPLHLGHKKQIDLCKAQENTAVVCLMSGNYVQRGAPAVFDRMRRAKAAVLSGADLVLELPVTVSLSSAEGFAAGGVRILSPICDSLCFGAETADPVLLNATAQALLSNNFSLMLRRFLDEGHSFPAARQKALDSMGLDGKVVEMPNNILAVEYCKAILQQGSTMKPAPILRQGSYHNSIADAHNPSATAVRNLMLENGHWRQYVPEEAVSCFEDGAIHHTVFAEKAILAKLRTMFDAEFEALPYCSEGLWRKFMHASRSEATLDGIIAQTKSKRYTRTRLDRMIMCAFLGITKKMISTPAPYVRILAFNDRGREILKNAKGCGKFVNVGEELDNPWQQLEDRCGALYGLFAQQPEDPLSNRKDRIYYHKPLF